jgi:hypothetical protein
MKHKQLFSRISYVLIFLAFFCNLHAQSPVNFSGKWQYDRANSDKDRFESELDGTVFMEINQNNNTISFSETYVYPDRPQWKTSADTYKLDGKEQITKSSRGTSKKSAKWSSDKKLLTITNIDTQKIKDVMQEFIVIDTYSLSADKKKMFLERYRKNYVTGETKSKKMYIRK